MAAERIVWPTDRRKPTRRRHTPATDDVLDLYDDLIRKRFRTQRAPMPIVVLRAEDPDPENRVTEIVEVVHNVYRKGHLLCKLLPGRYTETDNRRQNAGESGENKAGQALTRLQDYGYALMMVRGLTSTDWDNSRRSQYKPYAFPRSRMLEAIEEAVGVTQPRQGEIRAGADRPDANDVLRGLGKLHWRPSKRARSATHRADSAVLGLGAALGSLVSPATLLGAIVLAVVTRLVNRAPTPTLVVFLAAIVVLTLAQLFQQNIAPLTWLGQANQWFTTTTFIGPVGDAPATGFTPHRLRWGPRRSWQVRKARANFVVEQLIAAEYGPPGDGGADPGGTRERAFQFYLQLRVLALLEDLRADHRRWAVDLRYRKRTWPPMLFLPEADRTPGDLALLQAISDVRSRRSEQDPLLILANSQELSNLPRNGMDFTAQTDAYEAWLTAMRVDQSPSLGSHWPWVLHFPVNSGKLIDQTSQRDQPVARRSVWNLWSRWTLAVVVLLLACAGGWRNYELGHTYCGGGLLSSNADLVWAPGSPDQCVGIDASGAKEFVPADGGVMLNGDVPAHSTSSTCPGNANVSLGTVSLGTLECDIAQQNQNAAKASSYVTFVYAGPLTSTNSGDENQSLDAVKELAGVYARQYYIDETSNDPLKLRIDIANGGLDMGFQTVMAQKIIAAARQDPTIVGVIGLGRNTSTSPEVMQELAAHDLVVVDTTNSSDSLFSDWNYFGLGATNNEEANALQPYTRSAVNRTAVIFERDITPPDPYSAEQAASTATVLTRAGFTLIGGRPLTFPVSGSNQSDLEVDTAARQTCAWSTHPSVVYLAGRSDDVPGLLQFLRDDAERCFARHVIVLSGDDLTKNEFTNSTASQFPSYIRVYYPVLTDTATTGPGSGLVQGLQAALSLSRTPAYTDPIFADGTLALAFDAAHVLYNAAVNSQAVSQGRAGIAWTLRCSPPIANGATGSIGFTGVHHGMEIMMVTPGANGEPEVQPVSSFATSSGVCTPAVGQQG